MSHPPANPPLDLPDPTAKLLSRARAELPGDFLAGRPIRLSRAPGRLDVMGGIADYTGSMVCEATLDRAAAVALQERDDRIVQVFSFNLLDLHKPFSFRISLDALAEDSIERLSREFDQDGQKWAGYLVGCLGILQERRWIDLKNQSIRGMNLALYSTVPLGAGVSSSAAIEVAAMINFVDHLGIVGIDKMALAAMCQEVENRVVGAPCGIMDQVSSCAGEAGSLLRMICQPHDLQEPLLMPAGIRALGINSNVKHSVGGGMYGRTRCAAFMAHKIILARMEEMGQSAGQMLHSDPMKGYLANLDPEDYKRFFRPFIPQEIEGAAFLARYGPTIDTATRVDLNQKYRVLQAADHHVLEAMRVRNFVGFLESAGKLPPGANGRKLLLDKAGHLMYASHLSYTNDALLGADECDVLVDLVRRRESSGFYGAKITGGGSGGTVAVLAERGEKVDAAIAEIMSEYQAKTGRRPEAFLGTSPGAWQTRTMVIP